MDDRHPVFDELGDSIRSRVGLKRYSDCHHNPSFEESRLTCSTWAHHVTLMLSATDTCEGMRGINLDLPAVQQLVDQLQEWLAK